MDSSEDLLRGLNERQREAVEAPEGPTLVLAGAGSGKTRVIVHRIAYLIRRRSVDPSSILAVTFTNRAANEMRSRVLTLLGGPAEDLSVHTFHAACLRLLRRFGEDVALPRGFTVYGEDDRRALLRRVLRASSLGEREYPLSRVSASISASKNRALPARSAPDDGFDRGMAMLKERYQEELDRAGAVDFDDLLLRAVELLECSERARAFAGRRFRHVLVDEYQDTNRVQYRLLRLFAPHGSLFVVGDDDQSIYNFRGADLRNILDFERDFPGARVVKLEINYRSTGRILRAAGAVIGKNRERKGKTLVASLGEGAPVRLHQAEDERDEAAHAAALIEGLRREAPEARLAVLLRTHAQTRPFEEELVRRGLPHEVVGGLRFYERREIKDALSYLRLLVRRDDDASFLRAVNVPARGIGPASLALLEDRARKERTPLFRAAGLLLEQDLLSGRARQGLLSFRSGIEKLAARISDARPSELLGAVLEETGLLAAIDAEGEASARERRENLDGLLAAAAEYESSSAAGARGEEALAGFLDSVSLLTESDGVGSGAPCLLLTLHAAKGLEFDAVFLAGLEEGLFPHVRAAGDPRAIEEERRLFYVGMTRARNRLFVSYARSRFLGYSSSSRSPSRFLLEIPADVLEGGPPLPATRGETATTPRSAVRPGALVSHATFGEGRVVEASGSGKDRKVTVLFAKAGRKRLLLEFAGLRVVG